MKILTFLTLLFTFITFEVFALYPEPEGQFSTNDEDYAVKTYESSKKDGSRVMNLVYYGKFVDGSYDNLQAIEIENLKIRDDLLEEFKKTFREGQKLAVSNLILFKSSPSISEIRIESTAFDTQCDHLPSSQKAFRCIVPLDDQFLGMSEEDILEYFPDSSTIKFRTAFVTNKKKNSGFRSMDVLHKNASDLDRDLVPDQFDNCPEIPNFDQADFDADGKGDACDDSYCEKDPDADECDPDEDGIINKDDSCKDKAEIYDTDGQTPVDGVLDGCPTETGGPDPVDPDENLPAQMSEGGACTLVRSETGFGLAFFMFLSIIILPILAMRLSAVLSERKRR